jgi:hypothetical protein
LQLAILQHDPGLAASPPVRNTLRTARSGYDWSSKHVKLTGERVATPSERIDALIATTKDWRGKTFARLREIIHRADPDVTEEWKWVTARRPGTPTWEHNGIICHINLLKGRLRLTLHEGAHIPDPQQLFNASLEGNERRAIDIYEGDVVDEGALLALVRAGVELRLAKARPALSHR